jgi:hypothetical protein
MNKVIVYKTNTSIMLCEYTQYGHECDNPPEIGVKPARPLVGRYFKVQFRGWVRLPRICSLLGWVVGPQSHR